MPATCSFLALIKSLVKGAKLALAVSSATWQNPTANAPLYITCLSTTTPKPRTTWSCRRTNLLIVITMSVIRCIRGQPGLSSSRTGSAPLSVLYRQDHVLVDSWAGSTPSNVGVAYSKCTARGRRPRARSTITLSAQTRRPEIRAQSSQARPHRTTKIHPSTSTSRPNPNLVQIGSEKTRPGIPPHSNHSSSKTLLKISNSSSTRPNP